MAGNNRPQDAAADQWSDYEEGEQTRRSVEIKDLATEPLAPHRGVNGFLQHWRRGLVGAVQSWARVCKAHVVSMLTTLIVADHGFVVILNWLIEP